MVYMRGVFWIIEACLLAHLKTKKKAPNYHLYRKLVRGRPDDKTPRGPIAVPAKVGEGNGPATWLSSLRTHSLGLADEFNLNLEV